MTTDGALILSMAPLRGVTTVTFRRVFAHHFGGIDLALSPFIPTVHGHTVKSSLLRDVAPGPSQAPFRLVPQFIGNDPKAIVTLARALEDLGYDEINWNMGCPWPMVRKKKRGSGLLPYPDLVCAILDEVIPQLNATLSIKVRLGVKTDQDLSPLLPRLNPYPLSEIIIHPRTAVQMYEGQADADAFGRHLGLTCHTVVYNGDLWTAADYHRLKARFPQVDRWMLGRGIIRRPMLAEQITGGPVTSVPLLDRIRDFHNELYDAYAELLFGPTPLLGKMKELWFYLAGAFDNGEAFLKRVQRTKAPTQYETIVKAFFAQASLRQE